MKSVGFAVGNLRARENTLLKSSDMLLLAAAKNTDELAEMLRDKGIGDRGTHNDVPRLLREETEKLWKYLIETAPDISVFEPFIYENDFHNYKAVLKAFIRGVGYNELLILPALTDTKLLERSVKEKRFDILPYYMSKPAGDAYEALTAKADPQLADCIIDAGCMSAQLKKSDELKNSTVSEIVLNGVFYKNIKAALRAAKANKDAYFLEAALTETKVIPKKEMVAAALKGQEHLLKLLKSADLVGGADAAEHYRASAGSFEKYADDRIISIARKCKFKALGIEPLIGFMLARLAEIKDLRIIYSGVKTGIPREKTAERLRELYG